MSSRRLLRLLSPRLLATSLPSLRDERGIALITTLIVMSVLLFLGTFALISSRSEIRTSANYRSRLQAQYFAESGIDQVVGLQNDLTRAPRFLFDEDSYVSHNADSSLFADFAAIDPKTGQSVGTVHRVILGSDPTEQPPPYRIRTISSLRDGSEAIFEAELNAVSLLDFATYAEASLGYCPPGVTNGRVYAKGNITIYGGCDPPETFMKRVEYTGALSGASNGDFREGHYKIPAYPPLASIVDLGFYEDAAENAGVCGDGHGLTIGVTAGLPSSVRDQSRDLFGLKDTGNPGRWDWSYEDDDDGGLAITGCRDNSAAVGEPTCYQMDLTLFDFAGDTVKYGGVPLRAADGGWLRNDQFNGVIYVEGELHVWGILGGRSLEDRVVVDSVTAGDVASIERPDKADDADYNPETTDIDAGLRGEPFHHHPNFGELRWPWNVLTSNVYSNNRLDAGEDLNGNGVLDAARRGRNLTIVTALGTDIVIDHNIFYGEDENGDRVTLGLLSGDAIYVDANAPRAVRVFGAKLSRGSDTFGSWVGSFVALPTHPQNTHRSNYWAKSRGDVVPADSTYVVDLNGNGILEADNGMGLAGDRNENSMLDAWSVLDLGNIVGAGSASYGAWATGLHGGTNIYDFDMQVSEPPCWPVLPYYGVVPGSFTEIRN